MVPSGPSGPPGPGTSLPLRRTLIHNGWPPMTEGLHAAICARGAKRIASPSQPSHCPETIAGPKHQDTRREADRDEQCHPGSFQRREAPRGYAGRSNLPSNFRELNDDFDVVGSSLQSLFEILRLFIAGDQAAQPLPVQASQSFTRLVPVTLVRIYAADHHIVLQDRP